MTETEQLKKKATEAYMHERMDELEKYIDKLFNELGAILKTRAKHSLVVFVVFFTWCLSMMALVWFGGTWLDATVEAANVLFWITILVEWTLILPRYFGVIDEIEGCLNTLEILGMIDGDGNTRKRLKPYRESLVAKMWAALKSEKMRKAFA